MTQLDSQFLYGPDMTMCIPAPTMVIPSPQMIAIDHPYITPDSNGRFTVLMPCHEWSFAWLRVMASYPSLPHLHVVMLCAIDYGTAMREQPSAAASLFIAHMTIYGYPPIMHAAPPS